MAGAELEVLRDNDGKGMMWEGIADCRKTMVNGQWILLEYFYVGQHLHTPGLCESAQIGEFEETRREVVKRQGRKN